VPATRHPCTDAAADPGRNRPDASLPPTALAEPPIGAEVGWSAFKLVVAPVCAFCAAAASR
jgi:hypothetical protein